MKVLRKGRRPWVQVFECTRCSASLEVTEEDCTMPAHEEYAFKCPECGQENRVGKRALLGGGVGPRVPRS